MKGGICLTSDNTDDKLSKLDLWRAALSLFSKYSEHEGVFHELGYTDRHIGLRVKRNGEDYVDVDLLVINKKQEWLLIELTTNPFAFKSNQLTRYSTITDQDIGHITAKTVRGSPTILLFDSVYIDTEWPQVTFDNTYNVRSIDSILDENVKGKLLSLDDKPLVFSPTLKFTLAPESGDIKEIKTALIGPIYQLLQGKVKSYTATQMVQMALDELWTITSNANKKGLITKTKSAMYDLIKQHLSEYLEINGETYICIKQISNSPIAMQNINEIITKWRNERSTTQSTLF